MERKMKIGASTQIHNFNSSFNHKYSSELIAPNIQNLFMIEITCRISSSECMKEIGKLSVVL